MSIIKLLFYTSIMDTQANIQKRKRADTAPNEHAFECSIEGEPTIIVDTSRHWLPSNIEYDSEDSDVDQPDDEPLEKSTLFESVQLVFSMQKGDEIRMGMPSAEDHSLKNTPALLRQIFII
jgi:hypothetical protein